MEEEDECAVEDLLQVRTRVNVTPHALIQGEQSLPLALATTTDNGRGEYRVNVTPPALIQGEQSICAAGVTEVICVAGVTEVICTPV